MGTRAAKGQVARGDAAGAAERRLDRVQRILRVLTLLQTGACRTPAELAVQCGVSQRAVYRDLSALRAAGLIERFDRRQQRYVLSGTQLPAVALDLEEALALLALGDHVAGRGQVPFTQAAQRALAKVQTQLPAALQEVLAAVGPRVSVELARHEDQPATGIFERVRYAVAAGSELACTYESASSGAERPMKLRPYHLLFSQRAWYVIGHSSRHGEVRTFKLSRFGRADVTGRAFRVPQDFELSSYLGCAWRLMCGDGKRRHVELVFDAEFAQNISETLWHHTQQIEHELDGSLVFRCRVDGLDELVWWVLSMGPHCVVRRPRELADAVRELAQAVVLQYRAAESCVRQQRPH